MCIVYHERNRKQRGKILKRTFLLHQLKTWHAPSSTGEASKPIGCCGPQLYTVFHRGEHLQNFCGYLGPHLLAHSHTQQTHPSVLQQVKWSTTCMNSRGAAAGSYYSQWCIQRQWNMLCSIHWSFSLRLYQRFSCLHCSDLLRVC